MIVVHYGRLSLLRVKLKDILVKPKDTQKTSVLPFHVLAIYEFNQITAHP